MHKKMTYNQFNGTGYKSNEFREGRDLYEFMNFFHFPTGNCARFSKSLVLYFFLSFFHWIITSTFGLFSCHLKHKHQTTSALVTAISLSFFPFLFYGKIPWNPPLLILCPVALLALSRSHCSQANLPPNYSCRASSDIQMDKFRGQFSVIIVIWLNASSPWNFLCPGFQNTTLYSLDIVTQRHCFKCHLFTDDSHINLHLNYVRVYPTACLMFKCISDLTYPNVIPDIPHPLSQFYSFHNCSHCYPW